MSKPVTNEEVEDVLSSIRRLVSEDKRPLAGLRSTPSASAGGLSQKGSAGLQDKLVLTPALRVAEAPATPDEEGPLNLGRVARQTWNVADAEVDTPSTEPDTPPEESVHEAQGSLDDMASQAPFSDADWQGDVDDDADFDALDALVQDALAEGLAQDDAAKAHVDTQADENTSSDSNGEAEWRDVALMHGDDFDEDENDTDPQAGDENDPSEVADHEADDADGTAPEAGYDAAAEPSDARMDATLQRNEADFDATVPLTAKIAALETAIGAIRQDWEPDGAGTDDYAAAPAAAMAWEDDVELDGTGSPLNEPEIEPEEEQTASASPQPASAGLAGDDSLMDEEALRDLVSEIVRAELQGALGERITRNVRKLVRREIHRALTAQELE